MPEGHTALVTGGAGFIGSHLVERLLNDGWAVRVIDDCSTGRLQNLSAVLQHPRLSVETCRISDWNHLEDWIKESTIIFHLAAAVGVELVVRSPIHTIETNLQETARILEMAGRHTTPVLLASTSEVYGKSKKHQFEESDDLLIGPPHLGRWSYACSKLMDEFMAMAYAREQRLPVVITRLFNTVGPRQTGKYGMVLPRFIKAALSGNPLKVYGDGGQRRCFCYVDDIVESLIRLADCAPARGQVVNIGGQEEIRIKDLARRVIDLTHSSSTIETVEYATAYAPGFEDMLRRYPVTDKLHRLTGFRPATSLREIILRTAQWQENSPPEK